jgi:carboxymethylenebutenolidase
MKPTRRQFVKTALTGAALLATAGGTTAFAQGLMSQHAPTAPASVSRGEWKTVDVADKTQMKVFVARPKDVGGKVPGVIVLQEVFGVNSYIRSVAERIAGLGYVAMAPDLFHRTAPGFESGYTDADMKPAMEQYKKMTDAGLELDLKATYDLIAHDTQVDGGRIGSVGYCMGGRSSFLANAVLPLQAAAVYYGGGIADTLLARAKDQHAPLLIFSGGKDTHIGREKQNAIAAALKAAGKQYADVEFSEAEHGFFCDQRSSYNPEAAKESWEIFAEFFKEHLKG